MKSFVKSIKSLVLCLIFAIILCVAAMATEGETVYPSEGYVYNSTGEETNIKWTVTEEDGQNVCRFVIDASATDKVQATVVTAYTSEGKAIGYSSSKKVPWYYGGKINKMIFGEGITGVDKGVYMVISSIKTVEVSKDFTKLGNASFECNASFNCFMVTGTEYVPGLCDLTNITSLGSYCFDGGKFTSIIFGEKITEVPTECFKGNKLSEVVFPANIKSVAGKAFINNASLKKITVHNPEMKIETTAFDKCPQFFTIVGHKGSTAEAFAVAGGYEFVDITTGEVVVKGTRVIERDPNEIMAQYPREQADASGLLEGMYNNKKITDTYWAYFKDSKTMVFISNATGYNETGNQNTGSNDPQRYSEYKFEVEHVIVGPGINKITGRAFEGFSALKTLQYSGSLQKIDQYAFHNCTSLNTIYRLGRDGEAGVADISIISQYSAGILKNTAIETVMINAKTTADNINPIAFLGCKNVVATVNDAMKFFAEENFLNLINIENPEEKYEHYKYINPESVACGAKAIASFDEATGTLTILGEGALNDIVNYYGGGSKKQPWFKYRKDIKKLIIGPKITYIGKYAFCQCVNLQEVELSASTIEIGSGAFEKCYNIRSIYVTGNEPVLGTFDLRTVPVLDSWTFAYNYFVVNAIINESVPEIGASVFEDCMNLETVYGTPGSVAETYAQEKGIAFKDASAETPVAKLASPPEMNQDEKEKAERDQNIEGTEPVETVPEETDPPKYNIVIDNPPEGYEQNTVPAGTGAPVTGDAPSAVTPSTGTPSVEEPSSNNALIFIIAGVAAAVVAAAVAVVVIIKKRKVQK